MFAISTGYTLTILGLSCAILEVAMSNNIFFASPNMIRVDPSLIDLRPPEPPTEPYWIRTNSTVSGLYTWVETLARTHDFGGIGEIKFFTDAHTRSKQSKKRMKHVSYMFTILRSMTWIDMDWHGLTMLQRVQMHWPHLRCSGSRCPHRCWWQESRQNRHYPSRFPNLSDCFRPVPSCFTCSPQNSVEKWVERSWKKLKQVEVETSQSPQIKWLGEPALRQPK